MNAIPPSNKHHSSMKRLPAIIGFAALAVGATIFCIALRWESMFPRPEAPAAITRVSSTPAAVPAPSRPSVTSPTLPISVLVVTPADEQSITARSLQELAVRDPRRALAIALAERDLERRDELLQAVVRGWASTDALAAAKWARTQRDLEFGLAFSSVFNGANNNPAAAVLLQRQLAQEDPENAGAYAGYLIFSLGQVGQFELAASVAADGSEAARTDLLSAAYSNWSERQPEQALLAAVSLPDPAMKRTAFDATVSGWARTNPQDLAKIAINMPISPERSLALVTALRSWIEKDPGAAADWISQHDYTPEMKSALEE